MRAIHSAETVLVIEDLQKDSQCPFNKERVVIGVIENSPAASNNT